MGTFVGVLLLASFLAVFASTTLLFALAMFADRTDVVRRAAVAPARPEAPPVDVDYPRLPL